MPKRNMKAVLFSIALLGLLSCKDSRKTRPKLENSISDFLTVTIKIKLIEDDIFEVYYAESVQEPYLVNHMLSKYIKGDSTAQKVMFRLPDRIYPMKLRIDLGAKRHETFVQVEEIVLSTGGNSKVFEFQEIKTSFRENQYLEINANSNGYFRKSIDGVYDPHILSGDLTKITVALFSEN